jgi:hypothetical protein
VAIGNKQAAEPAPEITILHRQYFFSVSSNAFNNAADEITQFRVDHRALQEYSTLPIVFHSNDSGAFISSRFIPPKAIFFYGFQ